MSDDSEAVALIRELFDRTQGDDNAHCCPLEECDEPNCLDRRVRAFLAKEEA